MGSSVLNIKRDTRLKKTGLSEKPGLTLEI